LARERPDWEVVNLDSRTYAGRNFDVLEQANVIADFESDVRSIQALDALLPKELDAVVHFAAETHNDRAVNNPEIFTLTNILGTEQIAKFCLSRGLHLHYVSTDEIYGDMKIGTRGRFSESSLLNPSNPYSASKAAAGLIIDAWSRTFGLSTSTSACGNNFGRHQNSEKFIPNSVLAAYAGKPIPLYGTGQNVRDWVHVDEHSSAIVFLLENSLTGHFNIGVGDEWSNLHLAKAINSTLGRPENSISFVSDRPGHDERYALDNSKLLAAGWRPIGIRLEDCLEELVRHYSPN
jgi:dTDP-glucose 4,6-dehydratase